MSRLSRDQYPIWVRNILKNMTVTVYRGKTKQILKNKVRILDLNHKVLSSGTSKIGEHVFVIGFEDEEDIWRECADLIIKTYEVKRGEKAFYRIEVFCSGVNKKEVYFKGEKILDYEGFSEDDIMKRKTIISTVIFDITSPD